MSRPRSPRRSRDLDHLAMWLTATVWSVAACTMMSGAVAYYLHETRGSGTLTMLLVVLGGIGLGLLVGQLVVYVAHLGGRATAATLYASGNLPPEPSFSQQEALIARGRFADAATLFEAHLEAAPQDHDARLAFAQLCARQLDDRARAERLYLEVRDGRPTERQERLVADGLLNLYRGTEDRGRYMAELARFAERFRGTTAAAAAKRELMELKPNDERVPGA